MQKHIDCNFNHQCNYECIIILSMILDNVNNLVSKHKYIIYDFWTWWSLYKLCRWVYVNIRCPLKIKHIHLEHECPTLFISIEINIFKGTDTRPNIVTCHWKVYITWQKFGGYTRVVEVVCSCLVIYTMNPHP